MREILFPTAGEKGKRGFLLRWTPNLLGHRHAGTSSIVPYWLRLAGLPTQHASSRPTLDLVSGVNASVASSSTGAWFLGPARRFSEFAGGPEL